MERSLAVTSTVDALAADLRSRILDGAFAPGQHMVEQELVTEYRVSRHTFRAAAQRLEHAGLLVRAPNRGFFLPEFSAREIEELFVLRTALEVEALVQALEREADLGPAEDAVLRLESLAPSASWREVVDADMDFHRALIAAAAAGSLERAYAGVAAAISLCMLQLRPHYDGPGQVAAEHREILTPLVERDVDAASTLLRAHLRDAAHMLTAPSDRRTDR